MRFVLVFLVACAGSGTGPAWPKAHDTDADGGESLAPHTATSVAAVVDDDDAKPAAAVTPAAAAATIDTPAAPAATTATPVDETINTEEIIIEIEE